MKRRLVSLSLLSLLSALPAAARRIFAFPAEKAHADQGDFLQLEFSQTSRQPAGTATLFPIGFEDDGFGITAFLEGGEIATQTVTVAFTSPPAPDVSAQIDVPLIDSKTFPPVQEPFRLVQGMTDFGAQVSALPYSIVTVHPNRAWTAKGVRVAAAGEPLTVRTNGGDTPLIITELFGTTSLHLSVSPALRRLLEARGVNVDELIKEAKAPNLRQRMVQTKGGVVRFRAPDPPLDPAFAAALKTVQVVIWSPLPITVEERER